ncbi:MAG: ribose-5-phosphate isomerase RpiA [Bacillota bacterium]|nr:ribose-5-phosphate isomerase RpiA [Bacillota bacterium]
MNKNEIKQSCAREALKYIKENSIIGLGGGGTIAYLIEYLVEKIKEGFKIKVVTPSISTKMLCIKNGIEVLHTSSADKISIAFDGCDEVDGNLNALKSGGGIHTKEKLIASMAEEYILLVDDSKFVKILDFKYPVVLEILKDSLSYVETKVKELGGVPEMRVSNAKDGFIVSDNGNFLMDVKFEQVEDIQKLERNLMNIHGVIDTSLFVNVVDKAIVAGEHGVRVVSG